MEKTDTLKKTKKFPGKIQNRHLDRSILLNETGSDKVIKRTIYLIGSFILIFIIWANFLEISEVATATGEITHHGDVVEVQNLIGGRIKKLDVKNGDFVIKDQRLMTLDPVVSQLELETIESRKTLLIARKIRLNALINGKKPDFSEIKDVNIKSTQELLYSNILRSYNLEKSIIQKQIDQIVIDMDIQRNERLKLQKTVALNEEELNIRKKLRSRGLNSRVTLLNLEKEYYDSLYSFKQIPGRIKRLKEKRKELKNTLSNITATYMENYSKELEQISADIVAVDKQLGISGSNLNALIIKSPVEGFVHDIRLKSPGQIARAGDVLLTVVPTEKPLVAKVRISARDIGHIIRGQSVTMRITTYDSRRYGVLKGVVNEVSPSVFIPKDNTEPYFEGVVELEKNYIEKNNNRMKLTSGMSLTAEIKTGSKYFIEYLLKPIYTASQTSFKER